MDKSAVIRLVLLFSAAACNGDVAPPPQITVDVDPAMLQVDSGATGALSAWVRTNTDASVTWTLSDESIATVERGIVRGVNLGEAIITAASTADPSARDSASVLVKRPGPVIIDDHTVIYIRSITAAGTNTPLRPDSVFGTIVITVDLDWSPHLASRLELVVDQTVIATQALPTAGTRYSQSFPMTINTAERDASGNLRFPNGPHAVRVQTVHPAGSISATNSTMLIFKN